MKKNRWHLDCLITNSMLVLFIGFLTGCAPLGQPTTNLTGEARNTGAVTMLRVDDAWRGKFNQEGEEINRGYYNLGAGFDKRGPRYVPLRSKSDVAGLDGPDRIVTADDYVVVSLNSGFIKYFVEFGGEKRKGEIALAVSFDAGPGAVENILIYSAKGQTMGSFLALDDWPVIGPVQVTGDYLRIRVVLIELDQVENQMARDFVKFLSKTGSVIEPGLAMIFSIAQPILDQIIALNSDDVVLDYRFALKRTHKGLPVLESPLLYGKYVLVLQEDRLEGRDVQSTAPLSVLPIRPDRMRFDRWANRVLRTYNYRGIVSGEGPIGWEWLFYNDDGTLTSLSEEETIEDNANSPKAVAYRRENLGFMKSILSEYELYSKDVKALEVALLEACRTKPAAANEANLEGVEKGCAAYKLGENQYGFDYPVNQYPEAYTILAQYPLHTHLVFSVERSLGGTETPYYEGFQTVSDYLQQQLEEARTAIDFTELSATIQGTITGFRKQNAVISNAYRIDETEQMERVCLLWEEGLYSGDSEEVNALVSKAPVYNEIYHLTGKWFTTPDEVKAFIADSTCTAEGEGSEKCTCKKALERTPAGDNGDIAVLELLKLTDPPTTGDQVKAVQDALAAAGFSVEGEEGSYGPNTEAAVKLFQSSKGLTTDGIVGDKTRMALGL